MTWSFPLIFFIIFLLYGSIVFVFGFNRRKKKAALQARNMKPWLHRYTTLTKNFDPQKIEIFYKKICRLSKLYQHPAARNLFFQAYQFTAKQNSVYALLLYLQYLHVKTPTPSFPYRKISEEFKKTLFRNKTQETKFLQICTRLKEDRNLNQAIEDTKQLFRITRREICLDAPEIRAIGQEQSQTAQLLGKYLDDDIELLPEITEQILVSPVTNSENALFHLFEQNNFVLNKKEIDTFARNKGVFRDSLIQQINETYYETVDDVLIEEEGENYTLNQVYYEQIKECP